MIEQEEENRAARFNVDFIRRDGLPSYREPCPDLAMNELPEEIKEILFYSSDFEE